MSRSGKKPGSRGNTAKKSGTPGTAGYTNRRGTAVSDGLDPVLEGEDSEYPGTELSAIAPRSVYQPPVGYYSPSLARFHDYIKETEVETRFRSLLHVLLHRPELPYNPYPGFNTRLRAYMEKFHLDKTPDFQIKRVLRQPLKDTYIHNLFTLKVRQDMWGLSSILRVTNPAAIDKYRWLIDNVTPDLDTLQASEEYSNQVMVALIGPSVFDGSFYTASHYIHLRLEFLITGPDVTQGISIFVNTIMSEIDTMYQSEHHFLLGVNVPTADTHGSWIKLFWDPEKIQAEKESFLQKMSDAVIGNKYIFVECVFLLDPLYPSYVQGEKQYGFNFIEVVDELREEGYPVDYDPGDRRDLSSFCEFPMASLHEGIFLEQSHAEAYLSIFQPQIEDFEQAEALDAGVAQTPQRGSRLPTAQSRAVTAQSRNQRFSVSQEQDVFAIQRHVNNRLDLMQPKKVRIDGFRFGDDTSSGPYAWQITTPLKAYYQKKIAGHWREAELFEIVYCVIILVLLDSLKADQVAMDENTVRETFDESLPLELYRLLHATSGRLHSLMEYNKSLRATIQAIANTDDFPVIRNLLSDYRDAVEDLFLNKLVERSQDQITIGQSIVTRVTDMMYTEDLEFASASHIETSLRGMKNINLYCLTLMMELAEDSLARCPNLDGMIKTMNDTFTDETPRPPTRYKTRDPAFRAGEQEVNLDEDFVHGLEDIHIKKHETTVVNVQGCMDRDLSPAAMAKDNCLLKYMVDTHLDEMWTDFLIDLAGGDVLPPNPYPRLISTLRRCAMKMDLFYEKSSTIVEKLFNLEVKLTDKENYIFSVPGVDAHGTSTALMLLDTGAYLPLSQILQLFTQKSYIQRKGAYRVGICLALNGPTIWYGQAQPYLNEIELHEHYYIQGPVACQGEAIQLFAVIVHTHMADMIQRSGIPVMGVYFGEKYPSHWTWDDVISKKNGFLTEFTTICSRRESIFMKAYFIVDGWRYVLVKKYFKLHYLEEGTRQDLFYPDNPITYYNSVFLSKERAAFHYQNAGPTHGGSPGSVANVRTVTYQIEKKMYEAERKCDWLNYYRHLLLRDLINQDQTHIGDAWRMFHSMAGQVEYVISMVEALQDLILISLQYKPFVQQPVSTPNRKQSRKQSRSETKQSNRKYLLPVDNAVLSKMVTAFYQKLMYVCEARLTMASKALAEYVENKLKSTLQFDPETGQPYIAIEDKSLFRLEEMKSIVLILQDTLGGDVHSVCTPVTINYQPAPLRTPQMIVEGGGASRDSTRPRTKDRQKTTKQSDRLMIEPAYFRPGSVESRVLDQPEHFRLKPSLMNIHTPY